MNATHQPVYSLERPIRIVSEALWDPGTLWTGVENFAPNVIRSPVRPTRSESQYRLSYPGGPEVISSYRNTAEVSFLLQNVTKNS
jgi:hypothetical protein